jgi:hypothetical protein
MSTTLIHDRRPLDISEHGRRGSTVSPPQLHARRVAALHHFATPAVRELPRRNRVHVGDSAW